MILAREVRVIDEDKRQIGILPRAEALNLARQKGLDLVEVAPDAKPPVCRIMDYGKFLYEQHKRAHQAKKHQKQSQLKEIKFRPKISSHDYNFKLKHIQNFLQDGNKVKITIMLRGREKARPELGEQLVERLLKDVEGYGRQDGEIKYHEWALSLLIVPTIKSPKSGGQDAKIKDTQRSPETVQNNSQKENSSPTSQ